MNNIRAQQFQSDTRTRVRDVNAEHKAQLSTLERMAVYITNRVGTPGFFLIIITWTITWILWNLSVPKELRIDKASEFAVWIFISNIIQLGLFPLLMVAQNLQTRHDELRAENEYTLSVKSEREIEGIIVQLHVMETNIAAIMDHLGISDQMKRARDRVPDLQEEEFVQRSQDIADASLQRLTDMHQQVVDRFTTIGK